MIELLIVIAVLGILAVAVIAAINPIEQINRSKDTGSRSDAEQLIGAIDRFYTAKGYYPWQSGATDVGNVTAMSTFVPVSASNATTNNVLSALSGQTGELKDAFLARIKKTDYNTLYIHNGGSQGNSTYICFLPKSFSFEDDSVKRCVAGMPSDFGIADTACNSGGVTNNSYSCLP